MIEIAKKIIMNEEGWREKPYRCTEGYPTVGWGFRIGGYLQILPVMTMTREEGDKQLLSKIRQIIERIETSLLTVGAWDNCNETQKAVMVSMAYQVGFTGLCKFEKFLKACRDKDWDKAEQEMMDSKAARQTPARWNRQMRAFRSGSIEGIY